MAKRGRKPLRLEPTEEFHFTRAEVEWISAQLENADDPVALKLRKKIQVKSKKKTTDAWYYRNRESILRKRRERYATDPSFREYQKNYHRIRNRSNSDLI